MKFRRKIVYCVCQSGLLMICNSEKKRKNISRLKDMWRFFQRKHLKQLKYYFNTKNFAPISYGFFLAFLISNCNFNNTFLLNLCSARPIFQQRIGKVMIKSLKIRTCFLKVSFKLRKVRICFFKTMKFKLLQISDFLSNITLYYFSLRT